VLPAAEGEAEEIPLDWNQRQFSAIPVFGHKARYLYRVGSMLSQVSESDLRYPGLCFPTHATMKLCHGWGTDNGTC
jgi:hypothetical protein